MLRLKSHRKILRVITACHPNQRQNLKVITICGRSEFSEPTVRRAIDFLEVNGYITAQRTSAGVPYNFVVHPKAFAELKENYGSVSALSHTG